MIPPLQRIITIPANDPLLMAPFLILLGIVSGAVPLDERRRIEEVQNRSVEGGTFAVSHRQRYRKGKWEGTWVIVQ